MTLEHLYRSAREVLAKQSVDDSGVEAEMLLRHTLGRISRSQLYVDFDREATFEECNRYWHAIGRRLAGEPAAYITGHKEFYGLDFVVDRRVLIPRPETELLVEMAIRLASGGATSIADIGTGCGAIAVSLAISLPSATIYATDVSHDALEVAKVNCRRHDVENRVSLLEGDMLDPLPESVDIVVANLPYVSKANMRCVNTYGFEPSIALDGGHDGLDKVRRMFAKLAGCINASGTVLIEIGHGQAAAVTSFLRSQFPTEDVRLYEDFARIPRVVSVSIRQPALLRSDCL